MLMEDRAEGTDGSKVVDDETKAKSKSLDVQSLYDEKSGGNVGKRSGVKRKWGAEDGAVANKKRSKSLNSLSSSEKKRSKSGNESACGTGVSSKLEQGSSQNWSSSSGLGGISLEFNDNIVCVPKRKRNLVRRKKVDVNTVLKEEEPPSGSLKIELAVKSLESAGDPVIVPAEHVEGAGKSLKTEVESSRDGDGNCSGKADSNGVVLLERKKECNGDVHIKLKQKKSSNGQWNRSDGNSKKEDASSAVHNDDILPKKIRRTRKKKATVNHGSVKESKTMFDGAVRSVEDSQDDKEENLEENAARMLSSRFDPSCTGIGSGCKSFKSASANGFPFWVSDRDFSSPLSNSQCNSDVACGDADSRILRPRDQHHQKGHFRKRRHFYEVLSGDFSALWALNRRIKVFWPLDQSWYIGHVIGYDPDKRLHHIKYDDREEEWINLQHERLQFLLFPSEVPSNVKIKNATKGEKGATKDRCQADVEDNGHANTFLDSESLSSWLARSTRHVKSTSADVMKRQKTSMQLAAVQPSVSDDSHGITGCLSASSFAEDGAKLFSSSSTLGLGCPSVDGASSVGKSSSYNENKSPVVYFRRRYRQRDDGVIEALEENSDQLQNNSLDSQRLPDFGGSLEVLADGAQSRALDDGSLVMVDDDGLPQCTDGFELLKFVLSTSYMKLLQLELPFIPLYSFGMENLRLFHDILMLHHGSLVAVWPTVCLEMLFVDNHAGLRFILLEGCLRQALACVFLILSVFHQSGNPSKHVFQQLPVTSIGFKLCFSQDSRKGVVSEFYYFKELKHKRWLNLDQKLQSYCILFKRLPLSECTIDNIKGLERSCGPLLSTHKPEETFSRTGVGKTLRQPRRRVSGGKEGPLFIGLMRKSDDAASTNRGNISNLPPFALLFSAAPTFFLNMHLELLMDHTISCGKFDGEGSRSWTLSPKIACFQLNGGSNVHANPSMSCLGGGNLVGLSRNSSGTEQLSGLSCSNSDIENDDTSVGHGAGEIIAQPSTCCQNEEVSIGGVIQAEMGEVAETDARQFGSFPQASDSKHCIHSAKSKTPLRPVNGITVEIPPFNTLEVTAGGSMLNGKHDSELSWNMIDGITFSPEASGSTPCHGNGIAGSGSSSMQSMWDVYPDSRADIVRDGFGKGAKKPRTQVSYSLPSVSYDFSPKNSTQHAKGFSHKRIRRSGEKRTSDATHLETSTLTCDANLLVTGADQGWRECGARVFHELADNNEWRLVVRVSGTTKYSYKAHQLLQPGSVNRFTHAMMWKGGKEWALEFPDRSQWALFKEMHEECYNRNIRAALVKNIPIPGVRVIEGGEDDIAEVPFVRPALKYLRQLETDVDMAMDLSHVLYDMDSDDERWISCARSSYLIPSDISDEMFEKVMDMLEKVAYAKQQDLFSPDELEELPVEDAPSKVISIIYDHWRTKRQRKGLPLIRHFQPPLWEKYQQELKEWELAMIKSNTSFSNGYHKKATSMEKPAMFSFCLKPRGLEIPHKVSKQRSQKKLSISAQNNFTSGEFTHPHPHTGRQLTGPLKDEKFVYSGHNYRASASSPLIQGAQKMFLPRDAGAMGYLSLNGDMPERNYYSKHHRNKSKKMGSIFGTNEPRMSHFYHQRSLSGRNGVHGWADFSDCPSPMPYLLDGPEPLSIEQLDDSDIDEFRLRDAASAAQHAVNMAKLKREKAQRLLYRADLAIHKAVVALMTAEAIKAASKESSGDA
ncbi:hypothetical protein Droror1_Dr00017208 [Drosera rotundifolia]